MTHNPRPPTNPGRFKQFCYLLLLISLTCRRNGRPFRFGLTGPLPLDFAPQNTAKLVAARMNPASQTRIMLQKAFADVVAQQLVVADIVAGFQSTCASRPPLS